MQLLTANPLIPMTAITGSPDRKPEPGFGSEGFHVEGGSACYRDQNE